MLSIPKFMFLFSFDHLVHTSEIKYVRLPEIKKQNVWKMYTSLQKREKWIQTARIKNEI